MNSVVDILGKKGVPLVEGHEYHRFESLIKDLETLILDAQIYVIQAMLQRFTSLQDVFELLEIIPLLHVPVVLNNHLNVACGSVELQGAGDIMILLPLIQYLETLSE